MFLLFLLSFLTACAPASADTFWEKVSWNSPEGIVLVALHHPAARSSAKTWVLLHGLGSVKEEWEAFAKELAPQGNGIFLYDARGHQESNHLTTGQAISYHTWQRTGPGTAWDGMPADLASAVQFLHEQGIDWIAEESGQKQP